jgi:hypothetical protein
MLPLHPDPVSECGYGCTWYFFKISDRKCSVFFKKRLFFPARTIGVRNLYIYVLKHNIGLHGLFAKEPGHAWVHINFASWIKIHMETLGWI